MSENLYLQLFENSEEIQFVLTNSVFTQCNQSALNAFGYKSKEDVIGKHPADLSPLVQPDDSNSRQKADEEIAKAVKTGSNWFEWLHERKNGEPLPVEILLTRLKDDGGETILHASMHDISRQHKISNELTESENRFKQLSNLSFEGIIIHDMGMAIDVNLALEKISGYSRDEIVGHNILEIFVPEAYKPVVMDEIVKNRTTPYHIEALHKKGHLVPIEIESRNITLNHKRVRVSAIRDLSERKKHQAELEKSRQQYKKAYELFRLMLDNTPDMIWAKDMDGNFTFTNKAICEHLINANDVEEPVGKHVMYFVNREREAHPENEEWFTFGEECGDSDAITIQNKKVSRFIEYGNVFGKNLILDVYKAPLWDDKGEMIGTVGSARDITTREEAKKLLVESETRYHTLFENAPDPIIIHDGKTILDCNAATLKAYRVKTKDKLIGRKLDLFVHPDDMNKARKRLEAMLKGTKTLESEEFRILNFKNEERIALATPGLIEYKGKPAFMVTYHDITNRKKAEQDIFEKEKQFHTVVEAATDAIFLIDYYTTGILLANKQASVQTGYTNDELLNLTIMDIHPLFKDDDYRNHVREQVLSNKSFTFEFDITHKNGFTFPSEVTINMLDYNGRKTLLAFVRDITERRASEKALKESQERFKTLSDITFEGILIHEKGVAIDLNLSLARMFGYTKEELLGQNLIDLLTAEESKPAIFANINKAHAESYRVIGIKKDGTRFPIELEAKSVTLNNNRSIRVAAFRDITARVEAEEAYKLSEERFKKAFMTSPDSITISSWDTGEYITVNKSFLSILGFSEQEVLGKTSLELNIWKDPSKRQLFANEIRDNRSVTNMEVEFVTKSGDTIYALLSASLIQFSGKTYILSIGRDISARIKVENALKSSEEKFKKAFLTSPDAIIISDKVTGKFLAINNSFKTIMGYTDEDVIGKTSLEFNLWKDLSARSKLAKKLDQNKTVTNMVAEFVTKTGEIRTALLSVSVVEMSGKLNVLSIARDISDRIVAEKKLKELNRELRNQNKKLETLNIELEAAKQKAEESDRLKSAFLANMSHEIRTPMNGILGFSNLLKNMNISTQERLTYLNVIEQSGNRLLNIINDLIDISKIEAGQVTVNRSECNVTKQITSLYTFFKREAEQKNLELILQPRVKKEMITLVTDEDKLVAIFTNLIKNALKYTKEGSIIIGFRRVDGVVEFFVKDTGIGIAKDRQKAIFERFVQADIEDRDVYEGAGLGLAITKAYVTMLGGTIRLESEEGKGSTFYFTLPDNEAGSPSQPVEKPEDSTRQEQEFPMLNILIVEDEVFSDQLLTVVLQKMAKKIYHATSGAQAVELFRQHPDIDLIMMDIKMRNMDGYEATKAIRQMDKEVVIIAQTAYALVGDRKKAIEAGCDDYIAKPIIKKEVLKVVGKYFTV